MVKTTLEIEDEVYRKLVGVSLKRYGNTRSLSKTTNELLEEHLREIESVTKKAKHFTPAELKERRKIVERSFGIWNIKESGAEYVRKLRKESDKRFKRLGI